jgi:hypothetical protein
MVLVTPSPDGGEVTPEGTKKKKLTSLEKGDGRRLVEYLVVVSSIPRKPEGAEEKGQEWNLSTSFDDDDIEVLHGFKPQITARYPLHDHEDNPLHDNVTFFCHPSGSIHLKKEKHMPKVRSAASWPENQLLGQNGSNMSASSRFDCRLLDSLLCSHRRNRSANVRNLLDSVGTF